MKSLDNSLKEKVEPSFSMSDIDAIFKATAEIDDEEKQIDFFFGQFNELEDETVMELWDYFIEETMQTGISSGIDSAIGFNRWHGYDTELEEL